MFQIWLPGTHAHTGTHAANTHPHIVTRVATGQASADEKRNTFVRMAVFNTAHHQLPLPLFKNVKPFFRDTCMVAASIKVAIHWEQVRLPEKKGRFREKKFLYINLTHYL